jgi:hypothetical protein
MEPDKKRTKGTTVDLSPLEPFYVGVFVDRRSWGKRIHELACTGTAERHPDRWSSKDFQVTEKIGKGHFGTVLQATTASSAGDGRFHEVALKRVSKRVAVDDTGRPRGRCLELLRNEIFIQSS